MVSMEKLNALILEHSKKSCTIITIDELNKGMDLYRQDIIPKLTPLMDDFNARCFVVSSALRSKELMDYKSFSGRAIKVRLMGIEIYVSLCLVLFVTPYHSRVS